MSGSAPILQLTRFLAGIDEKSNLDSQYKTGKTASAPVTPNRSAYENGESPNEPPCKKYIIEYEAINAGSVANIAA